MKKQMKKVLCVVLSILMTFSYAVPAFAGSIDNTHLSTKQSDVKSDAEVKAVEKKIDAIGKVHYTDKSLAKIIVAENAYNALSDMQKSNVSNYGALKSARNAYDALVADNIDTSSYNITDKGSLSDDVNWFVYDNGLLEITGKGSIPSYLKGNAPWYQYKDNITSILVRSSVVGIGSRAFSGCNKLTEITLPFVGTSRDATGYSCSFGYIFDYNTSDYVSSSFFDGNFAPGYGYETGSTTIHGSPYYYSFSVPSSLKTVTITDADQIGKGAFHQCTNISKIVLNDGITSIGDYAFYNCAIKDFSIPNTVETIGKYAFYGCSSLQDMFIPNSVKSIEPYTFYNCNGINKLNISENVTSIGDHAFYGCSGIDNLIIPNQTERIGSYAFSNCKGLKKINIPDSVTTMGKGAFSSDNNSMNISELHIGSGLKAISEETFKNCNQLTYVIVPNTVERIGSRAFFGCNKLTEITLPFVGTSRDATGYSCSFGYIFDYNTSDYVSSSFFDGNFAPGYGYETGSTTIHGSPYYYSFSVPSSLKTVTITDADQIGKGAFHQCTNISKIVLNDGITSIGDYAFYNNPWYNNLTDEFVTIGDNVLIKYNGTKSSVTIPDTVKHIAGGVFKNNSKISEVVLPNELLSIGDNAFKGTALSTVTIPRSVTKIGTNAFPSCNLKVY